MVWCGGTEGYRIELCARVGRRGDERNPTKMATHQDVGEDAGGVRAPATVVEVVANLWRRAFVYIPIISHQQDTTKEKRAPHPPKPQSHEGTHPPPPRVARHAPGSSAGRGRRRGPRQRGARDDDAGDGGAGGRRVLRTHARRRLLPQPFPPFRRRPRPVPQGARVGRRRLHAHRRRRPGGVVRLPRAVTGAIAARRGRGARVVVIVVAVGVGAGGRRRRRGPRLRLGLDGPAPDLFGGGFAGGYRLNQSNPSIRPGGPSGGPSKPVRPSVRPSVRVCVRGRTRRTGRTSAIKIARALWAPGTVARATCAKGQSAPRKQPSCGGSSKIPGVYGVCLGCVCMDRGVRGLCGSTCM